MRATYCYANGFKSRTAGGPATPAAILSRHRRYRHAPCRDFPCLMRLWPGSPTATARPGRACCRASSGSAVRLIEASAPLRERASAGISDPYAGDVDHPPTSVHVLGLRGREPGADQFGDELRPTRVLLRRNERSRHFANVLDEKPNQRAQHPVSQRQDRNRVPINLQINRQNFQTELGGIEA
jgi:hypothetical protein